MESSPCAVIAHSADFRTYRDIPILESSRWLDIDTIDAHRFDEQIILFLLDWGNDVEKGLSVLGHLKHDLPRSPVIVVSRIESAQIVKRCFRLGAREFFCHPFSLYELTATVESLVWITLETAERRTPFSPLPSSRDKHSSIEQVPLAVPVQIKNSIEFIVRECCREISLDELAEVAGLSKFHFSRLFSKYLGITPMQYIASCRIRLAEKFLLETSESITTVAHKTGFYSHSAFINHFRNATGCTPSEYRKKHLLAVPDHSDRH